MTEDKTSRETDEELEIEDEADDESSLAEQLEKAKQDYLYLAADFENFRKNAIKERSELVKFGNERLLRDLLDVVDNLERALAADTGKESKESLSSGVQMIHSELQSLLQRYGVTAMDSLGKPFDPNTHEALSSEPTNKIPPGHITQVFKKAYKYHDRLLRPAQVVVASELPQQE